MSLSINTSSYTKPRTIEVDGKTWTIRMPGAADELAMSQAKRRVDYLDKKITNGTANDADYDLYDQLEKTMYNVFLKIFKDSTDDNSEVKAWVESTSLPIIQIAFEDLKRQVAESDEAKNNSGTPKTT